MQDITTLHSPDPAIAQHTARMDQWQQDHRNASRRRQLALYPEHRQAAVAQHYASLAETAREMLHLTRHRQYANTADVQQLIDRCEQQIRDAHVECFGAEPTWWPRDEIATEGDR